MVEWRVSLAGRVAAVLTALFLVAVGGALLLSFIGEGSPLRLADYIVAGLIALVSLPILVMAFRPRIRVAGGSITITNPLGMETVHLDEIVQVAAGWSGIDITKSDGETITAWAVQKSRLSGWLDRETRADRVAASIRRSAGLPD